MPLIRVLMVVFPIARRLLRNPKVRARLGLKDRGGDVSKGSRRR